MPERDAVAVSAARDAAALINNSSARRRRGRQLKNELRRISISPTGNPWPRAVGFRGPGRRRSRGVADVIIQESAAKQRVNLGPYGNERKTEIKKKKDRYVEGPLLRACYGASPVGLHVMSTRRSGKKIPSPPAARPCTRINLRPYGEFFFLSLPWNARSRNF